MIKFEIKVLENKIKTISQNKSLFYIIQTPVEHWYLTVNDYLTNNPDGGIYILISNESNQMYIGQTKDFVNRINEHVKNKDWIEQIIFISSSRANQFFSKTDLDFFEKTLIKTFTIETDWELVNNNSGNTSNLDPIRRVELTDDFKELKEMLLFTNLKFDSDIEIKDSINKQIIDNESSLEVKLTNTNIIGLFNPHNNKILISEGTKFLINEKVEDIIKSFKKYSRLIEKGIIARYENSFRFNEDIESSPSFFSDLFKGSSTNGWTTWKIVSNNKSLDSIRKKANIIVPEVDDDMIILKVLEDTEEKDYYGDWKVIIEKARKYNILAISKIVNGKRIIVKTVKITNIIKVDDDRYAFKIEENLGLDSKYKNLDVSFNKGANPVFYLKANSSK